ncbi:cytochrome P450 [Hyalangium gracile]|nr:cytochrome P450 [Hyalangium gracile]
MSSTNTPLGLGSEYHPFESPQHEDPHPFLARSRREEPVFFSEGPDQ